MHSAAYYGGLGICMAEPTEIFHRNVLMGVNLFEAAARRPASARSWRSGRPARIRAASPAI